MIKVKVKPVPHTEIVKIQNQNKPVIRKAEALVIKVSDDETAAYGILQAIKGRQKIVEDMRTAITKPMNKSLKEVNALFKTLSEPLKTADGIIREKILDFRAKREEAAAKRQAKLEAKAEVAEEAGDDEKAMELSEKAEEVEANVGESTVSKRWTFEIVDINKVPRDYLIVAFPVVNAAIRNGERNIPGLRIYQEPGVRVI